MRTLVVALEKRIKILERGSTDLSELAITVGDLVTAQRKQKGEIEALRADLGMRAGGSKATAPVSQETPRSDGPGAVREERSASISPAPRVSGIMPTTSEKKKLLAIVASKHFSLARVTIEDFSSCFDFIAACSRKDKLDTQTAPADWLDQCSRHTRDWSVNIEWVHRGGNSA